MAEAGNERDLTKGEKTKYRLARTMKQCMQTTTVENITVKQSKKKTFSSWQSLLMQMHAHREIRRMQV